MEDIKVIHLSETDSTNRYLSQYKGDEGRIMTIVTVEYQTKGRGQGTHTWESEKGKNLMFSIKITPKELPVTRQYVAMQAEALAIFHTLSSYSDGFSIKWPNDIYWNNHKISGTLSESSISANRINSVILGTGININQDKFSSDAPNPISLYNITGKVTELNEVLEKIIAQLTVYIDKINQGDYNTIHREYMTYLYRKTGYHKYTDSKGEFTAMISEIKPNGRIVLQRKDGSQSEYDFCEVHFALI